MSKSFIAYTRVSTLRQGQAGVSLQEQQRVIQSYADAHNLHITDWYKEQQTASKKGRPVFDTVIKELSETPRASGLILHKVDRGARNLRDWASIGEAIDLGVDVRFAGDDFDLRTRGGRLAADIQAVIAADYIRNLREEVKKGMRGRLNQGLYPLRAPRGYRDQGGGRVKSPDPIIAPLIISAFERYATGRYTYRQLAEELAIQGLYKSDGKPLRPDMIAQILKNPFYVGDMVVAGNQYPGLHQPLITRELFETVQQQLKRRRHQKIRRSRLRYAGLLNCRHCDRRMTGERQKQYVYYRCHGNCRVSVREDRISSKSADYTLKNTLHLSPFSEFESP